MPNQCKATPKVSPQVARQPLEKRVIGLGVAVEAGRH
jgi:hypothetical protein